MQQIALTGSAALYDAQVYSSMPVVKGYKGPAALIQTGDAVQGREAAIRRSALACQGD